MRYWRDWSSDVCSSDIASSADKCLDDSLGGMYLTCSCFDILFLPKPHYKLVFQNSKIKTPPAYAGFRGTMPVLCRSEERRVGKWCGFHGLWFVLLFNQS